MMPEVQAESESVGSVTLACGTDSQGNMYLMDKLLTTKYPLGVVLMELATRLGRRAATLRADWIPRLQNEEADGLTNWDFCHFDPARRIDVKLEDLHFHILTDLFVAGDEYISELEELKVQGKAASSSTGPQKKRHKSKRARLGVTPVTA